MKKFKTLLAGLLCIAALVFGGCAHLEESFVVDQDNNVTVKYKYAFNKEETEARMAEDNDDEITMEDMLAEFEVETIDGVEYYTTEESQTYSAEEVTEALPDYIITKDKFYTYSGMSEGEEDIESGIDDTLEESGLSVEDIEYYGICVQLPSEVEKTNGTLQEDKQTVVWDLTSLLTDTTVTEIEMYAYTANDPADPEADRKTIEQRLTGTVLEPNVGCTTATPAPNSSNSHTTTTMETPQKTTAPQTVSDTNTKKDTKAPVIKGIKKNKSYKKKVTVYVKDNQKLKKVTVNGKKVKLKKVKTGKYKGYYKFVLKKAGKQKIVATDVSGNKKKMTVRIKK